MGEVSLFIAFTAGLLSFLSPCVLPIIPGYLSYISGVAWGDKSQQRSFNVNVLFASLLFVVGFSVIFSLLGAGATTLGQFLRDYQEVISKVGGGVVVFFGLHFAGAFLRRNFLKEILGIGVFILSLHLFGAISQRLLFDLLGILLVVLFLYSFNLHEKLYRQMRIEARRKMSVLGALLMGMLFAFGWSPCIGPVLGSILLYASQQETAVQGAILLFSYSMGLGIPFIIAGGLLSAFLSFVKSFSKFFGLVEFIGGLILVVLGILLTTGRLSLLSNLSF